jgi:DNA-binding transcriptional LysR family regulator
VYPGIELRLLQCVVAVADELSFTRAAEKLFIAQPALSRQIKELETSLGVKLFDRSTRQVRLTQAGQVFVEEARAALAHSERARDLAKAVSQSETGPLMVGFSPHLNFELLTIIKKRGASAFGDQGIVFTSNFTREQAQMVLDGRLDIGLGICPPPDPALQIHLLMQEPAGVILSKDHKLCKSGRNMVRLEELKNEALILLPERLNPELYREVREFWDSIGYKFKVTQEVSTISEAAALVSAGMGMSFAKLSTRQVLPPSVKMLELPKEEAPMIRMTAFVRKNGRSKKTDKFLALLAGLKQRRQG